MSVPDEARWAAKAAWRFHEDFQGDTRCRSFLEYGARCFAGAGTNAAAIHLAAGESGVEFLFLCRAGEVMHSIQLPYQQVRSDHIDATVEACAQPVIPVVTQLASRGLAAVYSDPTCAPWSTRKPASQVPSLKMLHSTCNAAAWASSPPTLDNVCRRMVTAASCSSTRSTWSNGTLPRLRGLPNSATTPTSSHSVLCSAPAAAGSTSTWQRGHGACLLRSTKRCPVAASPLFKRRPLLRRRLMTHVRRLRVPQLQISASKRRAVCAARPRHSVAAIRNVCVAGTSCRG